MSEGHYLLNHTASPSRGCLRPLPRSEQHGSSTDYKFKTEEQYEHGDNELGNGLSDEGSENCYTVLIIISSLDKNFIFMH